MALTLESELRLKKVGLDQLLKKNSHRWEGLAKSAHDFVSKNFPDKAAVRPDDVAKALVPLLEVDAKLNTYLAEENLKQKYWIRDFCDLILDRCWKSIAKESKEAGT